jgi:hypothetical protein
VLTLGVEFGPNRADGSVAVVRVDRGSAWEVAGGVAGDLCCAIDGVPASQALDEWQNGSRPPAAGVMVTAELTRDDRALTIKPCWREVADPEAAELPAADAATVDAEQASSVGSEATLPTAGGLEDLVRQSFGAVTVGGEVSFPQSSKRSRIPDYIEALLDPFDASRPLPPPKDELRITTPQKASAQTVQDRKIREVVEWQKQRSRDSYSAIHQADYDPFRYDADDYDPFRDAEW